MKSFIGWLKIVDDVLGGDPIQHREVQEHESDLFLKYFNNQIKLLDGGVDSGFKHVEPEKYQSRLLHLKGKTTKSSNLISN